MPDAKRAYAETDLSDISLKWMMENAARAGLAFDEQVVSLRPLGGKPAGVLHNSKKGMYRLTSGIDRPIGIGGSQSIHPSAIERWDRSKDYRPSNLRDYFKATGDPRASQR